MYKDTEIKKNYKNFRNINDTQKNKLKNTQIHINLVTF